MPSPGDDDACSGDASNSDKLTHDTEDADRKCAVCRQTFKIYHSKNGNKRTVRYSLRKLTSPRTKNKVFGNIVCATHDYICHTCSSKLTKCTKLVKCTGKRKYHEAKVNSTLGPISNSALAKRRRANAYIYATSLPDQNRPDTFRIYEDDHNYAISLPYENEPDTSAGDEKDHNYSIDTTKCFYCRSQDSLFNAVEIAPESMIQEAYSVTERKHNMVCSKCAAKLKTYVDKANAKKQADQRKERIIRLAGRAQYAEIIRTLGKRCWLQVLQQAGNTIKQELQRLPVCGEIMTELCQVALQLVDKLENDLASDVTRTKLLITQIFKPWLPTVKPPPNAKPTSNAKPPPNAKPPANAKPPPDARPQPKAKPTTGEKNNRHKCKRHYSTKINTGRGVKRPRSKPATESTGCASVSTEISKSENHVHSKLSKSNSFMDTERTGVGTLSVDTSKDVCGSLRRTKTSIHTKHKCDPILNTKASKYTRNISTYTVTRDTAVYTDNATPFEITKTEIKNKSAKHKPYTPDGGSRIVRLTSKSGPIARRLGGPCTNNVSNNSSSCKGPERTTSYLKHKPKRKCTNVDIPSTETEEAYSLWGADIRLPLSEQNKSDTGATDDSVNHIANENQWTDTPLNTSSVQLPVEIVDVEIIYPRRSVPNNDEITLKNKEFNTVKLNVSSLPNDLVPISDQSIIGNGDLFYDTLAMVISDGAGGGT